MDNHCGWNRAQHQRSVRLYDGSLLVGAIPAEGDARDGATGGRDGSVGRASEAHGRSALGGSIPVGVDSSGGSTRDRPQGRSI